VNLRTARETKIRLLPAIVGLAISFVMSSFAQQKDAVDPQLAEQVRALAARYDEAFNRNDAAAVAVLYTEGSVLRSPHGAFHR
jgi:hypothetical protein